MSNKHEQYVRKVTEVSRQYAQELLEQNEKLRARAAALQSDNVQLTEQVKALKEEVHALQDGHSCLKQALADNETECAQYSERYLEVERQNANLANLYVASYQLHGSLDRDAVLSAIQEIVANLIGSEELAIFEVDGEGSELSLSATFGLDAERFEGADLDDGPIGWAVRSGRTYVVNDHDNGNGNGNGNGDSAEPTELTACIPLLLDGQPLGAIAVGRLLPQKSGYEDIDRELFDLLATHAATALYLSRLHLVRADIEARSEVGGGRAKSTAVCRQNGLSSRLILE